MGIVEYLVCTCTVYYSFGLWEEMQILVYMHIGWWVMYCTMTASVKALQTELGLQNYIVMQLQIPHAEFNTYRYSCCIAVQK